jgi:hypothetical protein
MRQLIATTLLMTLTAGYIGWSAAQGVKPAPPPPPHPAPLQGKVVSRELTKLEPFHSPVLNPPRIHPLPIEGRNWHWHPSYGWVALPVGAVQTVALPANYRLPAEVVYYESIAVPALQTTCPHCGQPIQIQVR